jgi:hypothetical protein
LAEQIESPFRAAQARVEHRHGNMNGAIAELWTFIREELQHNTDASRSLDSMATPRTLQDSLLAETNMGWNASAAVSIANRSNTSAATSSFATLMQQNSHSNPFAVTPPSTSFAQGSESSHEYWANQPTYHSSIG